ncbi:hypothetical protein [Aureimonas populi]|uniref:Uncharacterized protein n=1 Tax=Aureimonas populi TaxID=1701758 RepID=A0ABW5CPD4_9HYPH|nr:hypothetical protein [Aureimonas populi]
MTQYELPSAPEVALTLLVVGLLFLVRFVLAIRRLEPQGGQPILQQCRRVSRPCAFGADLEPERRHALRQLVTGIAVSGAGLAFGGWLLLSSVLGPFFAQAFGR